MNRRSFNQSWADKLKVLRVVMCVSCLCIPCGGADDRSSAPGVPQKDEVRIEIKWPKDRTTIVVPLEFIDNIPVIKCKLNGKTSVLYVDTASQPTCLYQDRLDRFGIKIAGKKDWPSYTAAGYAGQRTVSGKFELAFEGGLQLNVSRAVCLPGGGRDPKHSVDGILGMTIMKALNAVIDLGAGKITFALKAASEPAGAANGSPP